MTERDELVALARELERTAEDGAAGFESKLARFNAALRCQCDRRTFRDLYKSMEPEELVNDLLVQRDALPYEPPRTRAELEALLARVDANAPSVWWDRAGDALASMSKLPRELAHQLGSGTGQLPCWPPAAEIVDFALAYSPPTTRDEVLALARRWLEDEEAGRRSIHVAIGQALLQDAHRRLELRELDSIIAGLGVGTAPRRKVALESLRALVGIAPRARKHAREPAVERVRHAKFGIGKVAHRAGSGDDAKLTIEFESGTKVLLARFVEPCD
jgi:hypothetical protein